MILSKREIFNNEIPLFDVDFNGSVKDNNPRRVGGGERYDRRDHSYINQQTCTR
jgi:hypothetical protein